MSAKKRKQKVEVIPTVKLVHRFSRNQHRLEIHDPVKDPIIGDWVGYKDVAVLQDYRGTTNYFDKIMPTVSIVKPVSARIVND